MRHNSTASNAATPLRCVCVGVGVAGGQVSICPRNRFLL